MIRNDCDRESLLLASLRSGDSTHELDDHLATCGSCSETTAVAKSLLQHSAITSAQNLPPTAKRVWRKMQERQRHFARKQATRGLTVMWVLAAAYLLAFTVWNLSALWPVSLTVLQATYSPLLNGTVLAGIMAASAFIVIGALSLLFVERQNFSTLTHKEKKS